MRLNLFWKFSFAFLALLVSVLLAVDFFAERALRSDYERTGFEKLAAIARIAQARPPQWTPASSGQAENLSPLRDWVTQMAASGARITVIASDGRVLADSQSDAQTMENHANRPEILEALAKGNGRSIRHSVTIQRDLLYYAVRQERFRGDLPFSCALLFPWKPLTKCLTPSGAGFGSHRSSFC